jgi:hypothetical protein
MDRARVSLERGDDRSPERRIRSRKRQPELTQYLEIGNGRGIALDPDRPPRRIDKPGIYIPEKNLGIRIEKSQDRHLF